MAFRSWAWAFNAPTMWEVSRVLSSSPWASWCVWVRSFWQLSAVYSTQGSRISFSRPHKNSSIPGYQSANSRRPNSSPSVITTASAVVSGISGSCAAPCRQRRQKCQSHAATEPRHTPPSRCRMAVSRSQSSSTVSAYSTAMPRAAIERGKEAASAANSSGNSVTRPKAKAKSVKIS